MTNLVNGSIFQNQVQAVKGKIYLGAINNALMQISEGWLDVSSVEQQHNEPAHDHKGQLTSV